MSAYLDEITLLEKIDLQQIASLTQLLQSHQYNKKEFIEQRYRDQAPHFEQTLEFLKDIGWISEGDNKLSLVPSALDEHATIDKQVLERLIGTSNPYQAPICDYLTHYVVAEKGIVYRPAGERRFTESAVRNLMINLKVISYEMGDEWYRLNPQHAGLYLWAKNNKNTASKKALEAQDKKREALGTAAELAILEFERNRVASAWRSRVEHVSATLPFACYDIKSVTITDNQVEPRYIEVKAVSEHHFNFYWTAGEIQAAQLLGDAYYLYLLPVKGDGFDLDKLLIIQNPHTNVLRDSGTWSVRQELITCQLVKASEV